MIALWERRRRVRPGDCLNAGVMAFSQSGGSAKVVETLLLSSIIYYQIDAGAVELSVHWRRAKF